MKIKSEIIAFLNSDGGIIYDGVEDDGSVIGFDDDQSKDQKRISKVSSQGIKKSLRTQIAP